ncbi:uncharacterized protein K444DRAFT_636858 [Hyaloscypha bicolor E]|uniref:Uncharacterized protein n=1 Tax=Hyaloscypha bicolor E TaxID=1095630 RepID=A0A2J6SLD8_9HELO|nr:uncharacterized protein K444DRAFT_636858 [Hyaloscypha bicolor E]PMD51583.1 hypothetical protein K444DRAFT_636858 [Hyaloscypha bicolor E]
MYRLSSQDPILDLKFSKDSRRLYDVRGTYGNVWEPNTLVRLADNSEIIERNSDSASISGSFVTGSTNPEHWFGKIDTVTAIGAQRAGSLYCYGTEEGVLNLCEVGRGLIGELERPKGLMSIEQITWSGDGRLIAFSDLSGKITIKSITRSTENGKLWNIDPVMVIFIALTWPKFFYKSLFVYQPPKKSFIICWCPSKPLPPSRIRSLGFDDPDNGKLRCAIVRVEVDLRLQIPLSLLPGDKLVFLDENYWLCTWGLPTSTNAGRRRSSTSTIKARTTNVKRHYFLPGDWINSDSATLCCVMSDGTLLYPRNGDVAVVQSETVKPGGRLL